MYILNFSEHILTIRIEMPGIDFFYRRPLLTIVNLLCTLKGLLYRLKIKLKVEKGEDYKRCGY